MNSLIRIARRFAAAAALVLLVALSSVDSSAQCAPSYQYGIMGIIRFTLTQGSTTVIDRSSCIDVTNMANGAFATGVSGTVSLGKTYNFNIQGMAYGTGSCSANYPLVYGIWIDLNGDGNFQSSERVAVNNNGSYDYSSTGSFTLPCTASSGTMRMRVLGNYYYNYNTGATGYQPDDPCGAYWYGEAEDYTLNVAGDMGAAFPNSSSPTNILAPGSIYSGTNGGFVNVTIASGGSGYVTYRILGPLPSTNAVYVGLNPANPNDTTIPCTAVGTYNVYMSSAKGPYAGAAGAIDLTGPNVVPGAYRLEASFVKSSGCSSFVASNFYIPLPWDLSISKIVTPASNQAPQYYKYPRGVPISISCKLQNVGQNKVTAFKVMDEIRDQSGTVVRRDTLTYSNANGLNTGDEVGSDAISGGFPNYTTNTTGVYSVTFRTELLGATDQQLANNFAPQTGAYTFEVQYDIELAADAFLTPTSTTPLFVGRPVRPAVRLKNNGLADASDIPATMIIKNSAGQVVYSNTITIPDCSRGLTTGANFPFWTPNAVGNYTMCFFLSLTEDAVHTNDTLCTTLSVGDALNGTYTIGTLNSGSSRNFSTIQQAVNTLYGSGVSGPVTFELTDASYTVGSGAAGFPALDLTSRISGVSRVNTVTFRPSLLQSLTRASISIRLVSGNGVGILFGQNYFPTNSNAMQNTQQLAQNANFSGYMTFDGGSQRAFRFMLDIVGQSPTILPHRAVFYLGNGTSNVTVKNSLIENWPQSTASYASALPIVRYLSPNFTFEPDVRSLSSGPESYSAGIVSRSKVPSNQGNNSLGLDTLSNNNNQFLNNEISGFGYGIVSLGIGSLFYNDIAAGGNPRFQRYYNVGTVMSGNIIASVRRAGIYTGYGENEVITNNRILNVGIGATAVSGQAAGIMIGGEARPGQLCYNNIMPTVARNEVSNISSDIAANGIYVEQTMNSFVNPAGGNVVFPNVNEAAKIVGNMIFAVNRTSTSATSAGIHVTTTRSQTLTGLNKLVTPNVASYNTRGDSIVNNTILMTGDAVTNGASVVGIGIQQATSAVVLNNAIAVSGASNSVNTAAGNVFAGLFYEGLSPKSSNGVPGLLPAVSGGLSSNRNAFWTPVADAVRYVETDAANAILALGAQGDYMTLSQWKGWTSQDINSVVGNFVNDYTLLATTPSKMRINSNPYPIGSILDRRGERTGAGQYDIDADPRGLNGARFTIGADEFIGRLYVNDVEAIEIINPVAYRSGTGSFSDAEYIMTKAPINVTARMRNNGSALQSGVTIQAQIEYNGVPVASNSQMVSISPGESADINFDFNFTPQSYSDMGQAAPAPFTAMARNVTPVYTLRVFTPTDENTVNNVTTKQVRFYLMRSPIRMVGSVTGVTANPNSSSTPWNDVVGRLNTDSLTKALSYVGLASGGAYDLFDRGGWEPRAVDYSLYRTLFWGGDTNRLTRLQRTDLRNFLAAGTAADKHNLVVASQEILGKHIGVNAVNDEQFVRNILRATNATTGALKGAAPVDRTPRAAGYDLMRVQGMTLAQGVQELLTKTSNIYDNVNPMPSLMKIYSDNQTNGLARSAYYYVTRDAGVTDSMMGVATNALNYNVVFLGADWRHLPRSSANSGSERVVRAIIEFIERSNGSVVPVELLSFNAQRAGANVNLNWSTASEKNSAYFDVERQMVSEKGNSNFESVANVPAAGSSNVQKDYRSTDLNVSSSTSWMYRLKMVDLDGSVSYSQQVAVAADENSTDLAVSPNPANGGNVEVSMVLAGSGMTEVSLVDLSGRTVKTLANADLSGTQRFVVETQDLASGVYSVVVKQNGNISSKTLKIVK